MGSLGLMRSRGHHRLFSDRGAARLVQVFKSNPNQRGFGSRAFAGVILPRMGQKQVVQASGTDRRHRQVPIEGQPWQIEQGQYHSIR